MALKNARPTLIQRCEFDGDTLRYDYMGSTEFEVGNQAKCLKEMFKEELVKRITGTEWRGKKLVFRLVAPRSFDFDSYKPVLQGLVNNEWRLQESLYMDKALTAFFLPPARGREGCALYKVDAWFDFVNGVFFTYTKDKAKKLIHLLEDVKAKWAKPAEPDSPEVAKLEAGLEELKPRLWRAGKDWFSLNLVRVLGGVPKVWLNPMEQNKYDNGWFTLAELEEWLHDRGPVMLNERTERRS